MKALPGRPDPTSLEPSKRGSFPRGHPLSSIKWSPNPKLTGLTTPQHNTTSTTMEASGGNATLPASGYATTIPGCDGPFSRPSVFGLFLTISFCLLTQPQGTLFFPDLRKSRGLGVALIRLYPPYSLAEAAVIIIYLIRSPWYAWREGHRPKLQVISTNKWYQTRLLLNLRPFTSKIRFDGCRIAVRSFQKAGNASCHPPSSNAISRSRTDHNSSPHDATRTSHRR